MIDRERVEVPDVLPASLSAPIVLDDSDYQIPDEWGLKEAYNDEQSVVHHGDTLYIAGTHTLRDVLDDTLIPLHLVRNSQRYQQALAALQSANGRVKYLTGHSLGGAVAAVLQEDAVAGRLGPNYRGFREVRTYGAPLLHSDHSEFARVSSRVGSHLRFGRRSCDHQRAHVESSQLRGLRQDFFGAIDHRVKR